MEARGGTRHGGRDEVVQQVTTDRGGELKGGQVDVVQCYVIQDLDHIGNRYKLVHRQSGFVGPGNGVGHLVDKESAHCDKVVGVR